MTNNASDTRWASYRQRLRLLNGLVLNIDESSIDELAYALVNLDPPCIEDHFYFYKVIAKRISSFLNIYFVSQVYGAVSRLQQERNEREEIDLEEIPAHVQSLLDELEILGTKWFQENNVLIIDQDPERSSYKSEKEWEEAKTRYIDRGLGLLTFRGYD